MTVLDNLDIKAYKKILKMYNKNPNTDVWYQMARAIERPNTCCVSCLMCCCFCIMQGVMNDSINKRHRAMEDLFMKKYPHVRTEQLVENLKKALAIVEKHKMNLYNVRERTSQLNFMYPSVTEEELGVIADAYYLLNPVVYFI